MSTSFGGCHRRETVTGGVSRAYATPFPSKIKDFCQLPYWGSRGRSKQQFDDSISIYDYNEFLAKSKLYVLPFLRANCNRSDKK